MYVTRFRSYARAIKGDPQSWAVLKPTGCVGEVK